MMSTSCPKVMRIAVPAGMVITCCSGSGWRTTRLSVTLPTTIAVATIMKRTNTAREERSEGPPEA